MSELRQDVVSGDWIIIAPERTHRVKWGELLPKKGLRRSSPKRDCPFENLEKSGNWPPILAHPNSEHWQVVLIPNKFPALSHTTGCIKTQKDGFYHGRDGVGHHDLVVTRDHAKSFPALPRREAAAVFNLMQERYREMMGDPCIVYTSSFANWGKGAGASLYHPHYQLLSLPIIPPDVTHSLKGSHRYWRRHHRCVHCDMLAYEKASKIRVITENKYAIAVAPYVSRTPYEVRIFPKRHMAYFERTERKTTESVATMLQLVLGRMKLRLRDPDYNFFIHSAPLKHQREYTHYHWHLEIIPKMTALGGFELSTDVEINVVAPEDVARRLR